MRLCEIVLLGDAGSVVSDIVADNDSRFLRVTKWDQVTVGV